MSRLEKNILSWIDNHMSLLLAILFTFFGIVARVALRNIVSGDYEGALSTWYERISQQGLYNQIGDYNVAYQLIIWMLTKLNHNSLYLFKMVSCIFDFALAAMAGIIVSDILHNINSKVNQTENLTALGKTLDFKMGGVLAYGMVLLSPLTCINSAGWAQCDVIYCFFALVSIMLLDKRRYNLSAFVLGIGFAFKLQSVFVLPIFVFVYFTRRDFSALKFLLIPLGMIISSSPIVLWGRSLIDVFKIYIMQADEYKAISMNYPSVWLLLCQEREVSQYEYMKLPAIIVAVVVLVLLMLWFLKKNYNVEGKGLYIMAFLLIYTCVLFLPAMHERYGFLYEILAIMLTVLVPKSIPLCIGLICISLNTYGKYLFGVSENLTILACINLIIYIAYIFLMKTEFEAYSYKTPKSSRQHRED